MKILVIEDDKTTELMLIQALTSNHYVVDVANDGQKGLEMAAVYDYDLMLIDVGIPKIDGLSLCKTLRKQGCQTPILLLTAKDASSDRVMGLDAGADDYVVKPLQIPELMARIRALLRRGGGDRSPVLSWENLQLNPSTGEVLYRDRPLRLTPKEYGILELLLRNPQRIFSRSAILDKIWDLADSPGEETVTTHIKALRQKLMAAEAPKDLIEAVYGMGYRLNPLSQQVHPQTEVSPDNAEPVEQNLQQTLVTNLWEKFKHTFVEQVHCLAEAAKALAEQRLTPELQQQAEREAHKLSGSFGMFGFAQGSVLAQEIEQLLKANPLLTQKHHERLHGLVCALQAELRQEPKLGSVKSVSADPKAPLASVLVIDDDAVLTKWIQVEAPAWHFQVRVVSSPSLALEAIAQNPPDILLLDLSFPKDDSDGLILLQSLANQGSNIPVVILSGRDSLSDRIEVARLGSCAYLQKPVTSDRIFQTLRQTLQNNQPHSSDEGKILIVDDDPVILASLRELLSPWGLNVTTLDNPEEFWTVLTTAQPDLLVLDVEMPTYSGLELCQVVRNDAQWADLPILFLTAHSEATTIQDVFEVGADDYIRKPMLASEVVTRILQRLQRSRKDRSS